MLRKRQTRRRYNEQEEADGVRKFNIIDQIKSKRFDSIKGKHLQELTGETLSLKLIQRNGFDKPILIEKPDGLALRVPQKSFQVRDVRNYVGHERIIDVMDVKTQKNIEMSMKDWCKYYESKNRDKLLNVISLEFSHTKLDELVEAPLIVKLLDWVDLVWPKFLKQSQTESTNSIDKMKYPKVQKYCLMSVKGSYTDFHIDFGGTSVWYHILRGKKIFWMVPPTELNLQTFEEWTLSGMQQDVFFGDTVEECFRVELCAGNTFFIPSGWIHAVYTLEDSLVFGGNFLHSFGIENQLKVSKIEDATRVPVKFRYPFYTEILWYVVQHYVHCLTGKDHLQRPDPSKLAIEDTSAAPNSSPEKNSASKKNKSIESEDETTESEQDERDKKNTKRKPTPGKRGRPPLKRTARNKRARKQTTTSSKKEDEEDDDEEEEDEDESTEIDSSNEDSKPAEKVTTCRMTKNSLLRLQYEVDEQQNNNQQQSTQSKEQSKSNKSNQPSSPSKQTSSPSSAAVKPTTTQNTTISSQQSPTGVKNTSTTINLAEMILNQETSKLNGWGSSISTTGSQTTWSSNVEDSEPKGPPRIYVTRYELSGLKCLVKHLGKLSGAKKNLPALIRNSRALLDDCRKMIAEHENDDPELAITGKPITIELLNVKKSHINDLIGQFFKPEISANNESNVTASLNSPYKNESLLQQQKFKSNLNLDSSVNDKSKTSNTSMHSGVFPQIDSPKSPDKKETKCLNSNKKLSTPNSVSTSNSGAPPRPKSPPTRPISNNQYTSRTKSSNTTSNNDLSLPGSFADLIAATSTEKKVFDVSGSDIASSLFGSTSSSQKHLTKQKSEDGERSDNSTHKSSPKVSDLLDKPDALTIPTKGIIGTSTSMSADPSLGTVKDHSGVMPCTSGATKSPEPPKSSPQKRFINPTFKPQNKEKLIYASAPYVSPVHDQTRFSNPYPWQAQPMQHMPTPSRVSGTPGQVSLTSHEATSTNSTTTGPSMSVHPSAQNLHHHQVTPATYTPEVSKAPLNQSEISVNNTSTSCSSDTRTFSQKLATGDAKQDFQRENPTCTPNQEKQHDSGDANKGSQADSDSSRRQQGATKSPTVTAPQPPANPSAEPQKSKQASEQLPQVAAPTQLPTQSSPPKAESPSKTKPTESGDAGGEAKAKKPAKPRGPPKKSKEARQVLAQSETPAVPVSVIKIAPSTSGTSFQPFPIQHHQLPQVFQPAPQPGPSPTKATKAKRPKKQKGSEAPQTTNNTPTLAALTQQHAAIIANQTMFSQAAAGQQQLYGFVAPPVSSGAVSSVAPTGLAAVKVSQPSYLLSRPFLFNTMPTLSTAQLQPGLIPRPPLRMISTSIPSTMGLPAMQQGARIVWATQPQRLAPTVTTTNTKPAHAPKPNQQTNTAKATNAKAASASTSSSASSPSVSLPSASTSQASNSTAATNSTPRTQPDNAALLSLATTALSTAPMISNPSLGGFANRPTAPQAIMVSSANTHPALFAANQHLFSPLMQRLPMAPIVTTARPGTPRSTGQIVFARLPNQNLFNSQPRYLITQPGFIQQRMQAPNLIPGHSRQTLAFAPYKPQTSPPKAVKTKKVRTS